MIGYKLSFQDNDSYAFRDYPKLTEYQKIHQEIVPDMSGESRPGLRRCEACGELLDKWDEPLTGLKIKRRKYDISCTYDGIDVASPRFREVYETNGLTGLQFIPLPDDPDFFQIRALNIVTFDAERRGTQFIKQCDTCGCYESILGSKPVYLKEGNVIPDLGFARTDLEFASGDEKHPLLLCGLEAGHVLTNAALKGLDLVKF